MGDPAPLTERGTSHNYHATIVQLFTGTNTKRRRIVWNANKTVFGSKRSVFVR